MSRTQAMIDARPAQARSAVPTLSPLAAGVKDDQASRLRAIVDVFERDAKGQLLSLGEPAPARPAFPPRPKTVPVVAVSSGKGGVGKTNTCVNLAIALAAKGYRPTLVDADLGMANADVLCGLAPTRRLELAFGAAANGRSGGRAPSLADLAIEAPGGFRLVPGAVGIAPVADLDAPGRGRLLSGLADLEPGSDIILIDTGAGMSRSVLALVRAADLALIVATPEPTSITDAYALIKSVVAAGPSAHGGPGRPLALVVNEAASEREARNVHARIAGVCARFLAFELPLFGRIALDDRVPAAIRRRRPLLLDSPRSPAARDLETLAAAVASRLLPSPQGAVSGRPRRGVSAIFAGWFGGYE